MNLNTTLALAKQAFGKLVAIREPKEIQGWNSSPEQRDAYIKFCGHALDGLEELECFEQRQLLAEGHVQSIVPESLLEFVREQMVPQANAIRAALDHLDPDGKLVRDLLSEMGRPGGARGRVRGTFEEGLQQVYALIDRKLEDWGDDHRFMPDTAYEIVDSKLIQFDPDAWLDRVSELLPVRTHKNNHVLPSHVRLRLEELYRVYIFGCWLSVFGLARSILEYSILDNLNKFGIESKWPPDRDGTRKEKKLSHLIDDLSERLPRHGDKMTLLRDYGNEYLHPKKSQVSKESLFRRQEAAKAVVAALVEVVEAIYLAPNERLGT
jgi:hypothetical protein